MTPSAMPPADGSGSQVAALSVFVIILYIVKKMLAEGFV